MLTVRDTFHSLVGEPEVLLYEMRSTIPDTTSCRNEISINYI